MLRCGCQAASRAKLSDRNAAQRLPNRRAPSSFFMNKRKSGASFFKGDLRSRTEWISLARVKWRLARLSTHCPFSEYYNSGDHDRLNDVPHYKCNSNCMRLRTQVPRITDLSSHAKFIRVLWVLKLDMIKEGYGQTNVSTYELSILSYWEHRMNGY
jgi:hypothetical protein